MARVHQPIGQLTVGGEQQQTGGVDVQAPHGDPARVLNARQTIKYSRTPFRILAGTHLAIRLVIGQYPADQIFGRFGGDGVTIDADHGTGTDPITQGGRLTIDTDPSFADQCFHFATGAHTGTRQHFL